MAIQTQFSIDHGIGYVGQIVDGQLKNFVSRPNTSTATTFGAVVFGDGKTTGTEYDCTKGIVAVLVFGGDYVKALFDMQLVNKVTTDSQHRQFADDANNLPPTQTNDSARKKFIATSANAWKNGDK